LVILSISVGISAPCTGITDGITLSGAGGVPPYSYSIDGGVFGTSDSFSGIAPGMHTLRIRDSQGTIVTETIEIAPPDLVTAVATVNGNDVSIEATGGTPPYMFTLDGTSNEDGAYFDLPNGNYTVFITDANNCISAVEFAVDYSSMVVTFVTQPVSCFGALDGAILGANITGGVPPYSISFPIPSTGLAAGVYSFSVTDGAGTTIQVSALVGGSLPLNMSVTSGINGGFTAQASGGTPPYQFSIDGGVTNQPGGVFPNLPNGTYTVLVTDQNGCTDSVSGIMVSKTTDLSNTWGISVSPNPSSGLFALRLTQAPQGELRISIVDAVGKLLLTEQVDVRGERFDTDIDLRHLPAGMYWMQLTQAAGVAVQRLQINR
jgi:hypothetical protein